MRLDCKYAQSDTIAAPSNYVPTPTAKRFYIEKFANGLVRLDVNWRVQLDLTLTPLFSLSFHGLFVPVLSLVAALLASFLLVLCCEH